MILGSCSRVTAYLPNLHSVVKYVRTFSSNTSHIAQRIATNNTNRQPSESSLVWPERELGPLNERDPRFPLPGQLGVPRHEPRAAAFDPETLFERCIPCERHTNILEQATLHMIQDSFRSEEGFLPEPTTATMLECVAHNCPELLRKDFQDLFPGRDLTVGEVTVVTLSLHTENDMSGWNIEVEVERDGLIELFVKGAGDICTSLNVAGFWADFIEPASGRPFFGVYTNATLFETDERYRKLGFEIVDLGCCKVIKHHLWGTRAYVGCLFTDAPLQHDIVKQLRPIKT